MRAGAPQGASVTVTALLALGEFFVVSGPPTSVVLEGDGLGVPVGEADLAGEADAGLAGP